MRYTQISGRKFGLLELMLYVCLHKVTEMKKVIYIAVVAVGFFAVSCTKENIRPCTTNVEETPIWRGATTPDSDDNGSTGTGSITDPNSDPDESNRKKPK